MRKARLDRAIAPPQRVIGRVRNARRILLVIAPVVRCDLGAKPRMLGLGLFLGEIVDGRF